MRTGQKVLDALRPLQLDRSPFGLMPTAAKRGAHWVRPEMMAEVRFQTWTEDGLLRHASFQRVRKDLEPKHLKDDRS